MEYRNDPQYKALEKLCEMAGYNITYATVPDDSIDGEIWARSDRDSRTILMPIDETEFENGEQASRILGHEMAHIITGLDSPDEPELREHNERECDKLGEYLAQFAVHIAEHEADLMWL